MNVDKYKALILLAIALLALLHVGVATQGYMCYSGLTSSSVNGINYEFKNFFVIFLVIAIAAGIQILVSLILMIQIYNHYWSSYGRYILASIDLLITFCLAIVVSLLASRVTIKRASYLASGQSWSDDFETLYELCISDAVITFVVQFLYLCILYFSTLQDYQHDAKVVKLIKTREPKQKINEKEQKKFRLKFPRRKY